MAGASLWTLIASTARPMVGLKIMIASAAASNAAGRWRRPSQRKDEGQRKGLSLAARKEPKQPLRPGKRRLALRKYKFPGTTNACALRRIHDRALRYARLNPQPRLAFCGPGCVALAHHDYPVQWCDSSSR